MRIRRSRLPPDKVGPAKTLKPIIYAERREVSGSDVMIARSALRTPDFQADLVIVV